MAGVITQASHPKALWPGVRNFWAQEYDAYKPEWSHLVDEITSKQSYEEFVQMTNFPMAQKKSEGQGVAYASQTQGFTTRITPQVYALGYIVTYEEIINNLYKKVSESRVRMLTNSFHQAKEVNVANLYNRAFNSSYTGGDGVSLCNVAHPNTSGGTFSNRLAVDADLSEQALEDMHVQIMGATDDLGLLVNLQPESVIVSRYDWYQANRILKSTYQAETSNNAINVLKATSAYPKGIVLNRYLTTPHAWFIRTRVPSDQGIMLVNRQSIQFTKDKDFDTMNVKAKAFEYYGLGWVDPRAIYGSNGP